MAKEQGPRKKVKVAGYQLSVIGVKGYGIMRSAKALLLPSNGFVFAVKR